MTEKKKTKAKKAAATKTKPESSAKRKSRKAKSVGSATLASILGTSGGKKKQGGYTPDGGTKIKPEWQKYYNRLLELHGRLTEQMHGLAKDSAEKMESYSLHMGDSGTDNYDRDFALSLLSSDQDAVYEIEEALKRIENGSYGVCELMEKNIPRSRLTAIPWTRYTVDAQAQLERDGVLESRRGLGSLGSVDSKGAVGGSADADDSDESIKKSTKTKA